MKDVEDLISVLGNEGATPQAIAEELNGRGFRDRRKMPFTSAIVESYMRILSIVPYVPPAVLPAEEISTEDLEDSAWDDAEEAAMEAKSCQHPNNVRTVDPTPYRAGKLREWPMHTDFRPDNLQVRD